MERNKDFYRNLPGMVCIMLDKYITKYKKEPWFPEAWEEYRQHILNSSMDDMKMPGYVFNKYVKKEAIKHFAAQDNRYELFHKDDDVFYGVPQQKKFPLPDADHVRSAIKFFNYVEPKYEAQLAKAILERAEMYNVDLSEMNIGDENRFKNYLPNELQHHGIKGQRWGIRRYQNEDGSLTEEGRERYGSDLKETSYSKATDNDKIKKAVVVGASIAAASLAVYGAYKLSDVKQNIDYQKSVEYGLNFYRQMYRGNINKANAATSKFDETVKALNELKKNNISGQKEVRLQAGKYLQEEGDWLDKARSANKKASKYFSMG